LTTTEKYSRRSPAHGLTTFASEKTIGPLQNNGVEISALLSVGAMPQVTIRLALSGDLMLYGAYDSFPSLLAALGKMGAPEDVDGMVLLCGDREATPADFTAPTLELFLVRDPLLAVLPQFARAHSEASAKGNLQDSRLDVPRKALGDPRLLRRMLATSDEGVKRWLLTQACYNAAEEAWDDAAFATLMLEQLGSHYIRDAWARISAGALCRCRDLCLLALSRNPAVYLDIDPADRDEDTAGAVVQTCMKSRSAESALRRLPPSLLTDPEILDALVTRIPGAFCLLSPELRTRSRALRALEISLGGSAVAVLNSVRPEAVDKALVLAAADAVRGHSFARVILLLLHMIPASLRGDAEVIARLRRCIEADAFSQHLLTESPEKWWQTADKLDTSFFLRQDSAFACQQRRRNLLRLRRSMARVRPAASQGSMPE